MLRLVLLGLMLALAAPASAQLYKWVDKDGRTRYTDQPPPPGVQSRAIAAPAQPMAPGAGAEAAGAPSAPLTPAQQEQAFQKRQLEAKKAEQKADTERKDQAIKQANCERARSALATFESGQRVTQTDASGERYYLDDAQREKQAQAARQSVQDWCN